MTHSNDDVSLRQILESVSHKAKSASRPRIGKPREAKHRDTSASGRADSLTANFTVQCEPRNSQAPFTSPGLSLHMGQMIRRTNREEIWESLIIHCDEQTDGTLAIRVIVSNPDWEDLVQIACIRSRPGNVDSMTALACNLDHEELS